jgi:hypothetical protein
MIGLLFSFEHESVRAALQKSYCSAVTSYVAVQDKLTRGPLPQEFSECAI